MKYPQIVLIVLLSSFVSLSVSFFSKPSSESNSTPSQMDRSFDRIMSSNVIRCGYYVFQPVVYRDPKTNKLSGFSIDFMEKLASRAGLRVEWAEEVTFGNWVPALQTNRYDVSCTPMWPALSMLKAVSFSKPMFYSGLAPLVRANDSRFLKDPTQSRLNQPDVTFVTQEGDLIDNLTRDVFPKAQYFSLPPNAQTSDYYQSLIANKADAVLMDQNGLDQFNKENKVSFKFIEPNKIIKLQPFSLAFAHDERKLKAFLDEAIDEMNEDGEIDRLLKKWEKDPGKTFLRVAPLIKTSEP